MGEVRNSERILNGKNEGESPLESPIHKWEDDIRKGMRVWTGFI
jgi:hypothetical protein